MSLSITILRDVARKEWTDRLRNRWIFVVAAVFALFAFSISYFGAVQQGQVGWRSVEVTVASLVSLVIYLLPLIALLTGFDAIVGERERGTLDLLLSMPLSRNELVLGKFIGLSAALTTACASGFGVVIAVLWWHMGANAALHLMGFLFSSLLMGLCFLSVAIFISAYARDRTAAGGYALATWLFFVILFDLILLAALVGFGDGPAGRWLPMLMMLSPTDVYRLLNIFQLQDAAQLYGLSGTFPIWLAEPSLLISLLMLWIVLPLLLAMRRFTQC